MLENLPSLVLNWVRQKRHKKQQKIVYQVIRELHNLTVTVHGRLLLKNLYSDPDNGIEPEIKRMYYVLVINAPLSEWSQWN